MSQAKIRGFAASAVICVLLLTAGCVDFTKETTTTEIKLQDTTKTRVEAEETTEAKVGRVEIPAKVHLLIGKLEFSKET